jgi:hypothetical protein
VPLTNGSGSRRPKTSESGSITLKLGLKTGVLILREAFTPFKSSANQNIPLIFLLSFFFDLIRDPNPSQSESNTDPDAKYCLGF